VRDGRRHPATTGAPAAGGLLVVGLHGVVGMEVCKCTSARTQASCHHWCTCCRVGCA
jgi:hypothetical protein